VSHGAPLGDAELVAFVASADLDRAQRFYEGTLGLELLELRHIPARPRSP